MPRAAAARMINLQQNLDHLSASCEREASGRMGRSLQLLDYGFYHLTYCHIKIVFPGRETIPQKKMECK